MKSASLKLSTFALALTLQLASSDFASFWLQSPGPLLGSIQNRSSVSLGKLSFPNPTWERGFDLEDVAKRQQECVDAGYLPCSNVPDACCPAGYNCFSNGCCSGSPGGLEPCPGDSMYCYIPTSEFCCPNGSCSLEDTCCTNECCSSIAYCAGDGFCSACPPATETETETTTSTTVKVVQVTITKLPEPEEADEFTCFPVTVTNAENATLELDTDCALSYSPPPSTAGPSKMKATPVVRNAAVPWEKQVSCTPFETDTEVVTLTSTFTSTSTMTQTVFTSPSESIEFSCPTMAVTNTIGDVLSLDESCALEFSPAASPSSTSSTTAIVTHKSTAKSVQSLGLNRWCILIVGIFVPLML